MEIHFYEDIKTIDADLANLFLRPDEAVNWIYAMENGIKDWIGMYNKQYWEIVRYVSEQRGILGKLIMDRKTVKLTRKDFVRVLLKFCPNAVEKDETISALKTSMDHYMFATIWKELDKKPDGHIVRPLIKAVENLLDKKPIIEPSTDASKPTLEDLLEEYLRREVEEKNTDRFPLSKVCIRPQYDGINPAISIETYYSEKFLKEHRPSRIVAYEFVDGVLEKSKLNEFIGQYHDKYVKLFIVSSFGLTPEVRALATKKEIGYVLLNPNSKMTSYNYVLPRSIEDHTKYQYDFKVLSGSKPMTMPLLIMDDTGLTSSLTDVLNEYGVAVKNHRLLNIPFLSEEKIEECTNVMTKKDVEYKIKMLKLFSCLNADLSIDPFTYADLFGLSHDAEEMEEEFQLGRLDVANNHAILNSTGVNNYKRYRFTMAHELGHHILHSPLFKEQGVVSVGETENTLSISKSDSRRMEYQANLFASNLLMPKILVGALYYHFYNLYVHKVYGDSFRPLYYNPKQRETWYSYNNVVVRMASLMGVSIQSLVIRLKEMNLLKTP